MQYAESELIQFGELIEIELVDLVYVSESGRLYVSAEQANRHQSGDSVLTLAHDDDQLLIAYDRKSGLIVKISTA
jgi:hypothetical protein